MPNRIAPALLCLAWLTASGALAQPASAPAAKAAPTTTMAPVTVTAAPPKVVQKEAESFVHGFAAAPNPEVDQIGRWRDPICVQVVGLPQADQSALIKARIEEVARAIDIRVMAPGCRSNIQIVFTDRPQALMDVVAQRREYLLGYYHRHDRDRLKAVTHPIQSWYVTGTESEDAMAAGSSWALLSAFPTVNTLALAGEVLDDPDQWGATGCGDAPRFTACLRSLFGNVLVVADRKAVEGKDAGLVADYLVMLTLAQPQSLDGCNALPSVIDLFAKSACPGRDAPSGLTPGDAAYLTALYKADLEARKNFEQADIARRMAKILINANAVAAAGAGSTGLPPAQAR